MEDLVPESSKSKAKAAHSLTSFLEICLDYEPFGKQKQNIKTNGTTQTSENLLHSKRTIDK